MPETDERDVSTPEGPWRSALYSALVVTGPALTCRAQMWIVSKHHICGRPVAGLAGDKEDHWWWACEAHLVDPSTARYIRLVPPAIDEAAEYRAAIARRLGWEPDPELIDHEHGIWPANKR